MLKQVTFAGACLLALTTVRSVDAHGTPIAVTAVGGALVASGSVPDSEGFAPQIAVQTEAGQPLGAFTLPNVNAVILWQTPGFSITGLDNSASLSIEVLERPVAESSPLEERVVWYWNPQSGAVNSSVADIYLLGTGMRFTTLPANGEPPTPFLLASNLSGQQHPDNHDLLSYALDNDVPRPTGAYGFFARLTSSQYAASNPFLVVLNYGVADQRIVEAALAINAAAVEPESLPGDFNEDGTVNAADFVVWRKGLTTDGDYSTWQTNFGHTLNFEGDGPELTATASVPEPAALLLTVYAMGFFAILRDRKNQ